MHCLAYADVRMQLTEHNGSARKDGAAITAENKRRKTKDSKSDSESDADSSDSEGDNEAVAREPGEFINIAYDDLVNWLSDWLVGQKPPQWIKSWSTLFKRMLPLHTFLRYVVLLRLAL